MTFDTCLVKEEVQKSKMAPAYGSPHMALAGLHRGTGLGRRDPTAGRGLHCPQHLHSRTDTDLSVSLPWDS